MTALNSYRCAHVARLLLAGAAFGVFATGCATTPVSTFTAIPDSSQKVAYLQGDALLVSHGSRSTVDVSSYASGGQVKLLVSIINNGSDDIEYSDADISAKVNTFPVAIVSASQLEQQANNRSTVRQAAIGFAGGMAMGSASRSGTTTYSGQFDGSTASGNVSGTYSGQSYNPAQSQAAVSAAAGQTSSALANAEANADAEIANIKSRTLQRNTIHPGQHVSGWVTLGPAPYVSTKNLIELTLWAGGDVHVLKFLEVRS